MDESQKFRPVAVNSAQLDRMNRVRAAYEALEKVLLTDIMPGRNRSVAITEAESSCMWAIKGISHEDIEARLPGGGGGPMQPTQAYVGGGGGGSGGGVSGVSYGGPGTRGVRLPDADRERIQRDINRAGLADLDTEKGDEVGG